MKSNQTNTTRALLAYIGQMLWLISAQLNAMTGGGDFPVPDVMSVAETGGAGRHPAAGPTGATWPDPAEETAAWPDREALLQRLKGGAP